MKKIFVGENGLRAGWKFLIFAVAWSALSAALGFLVTDVLHYPYVRGWTARDLAVDEVQALVAALLAAWLMSRIEKRPISTYGLPLRRGAGRLFSVGLLWGFLTVGLLAALIALKGGLTLSGFALHGTALAQSAAAWAFTMLALGLSEEFTFRGYPLVSLSEGMGFWPAGIALSLFFGGLHYFGKGKLETVADGLSVTLLALFLVLTVRRTGSLWFAAGWHAAFDYAALSVIGAPNTGNEAKPIADHLLATTFPGPDWLTGGPCGIEASWMIFPIIALSFFLFDRFYRRNP